MPSNRQFAAISAASEKAGMTEAELQLFRQILTSKKVELARRLGNREAIAIERSADDYDSMQHSVERDVAVHNLDIESYTLREVMEALERIEDGTFGKCVRCAEEISPKRLMALPWTRFCIPCRAVGTLEYMGRNPNPRKFFAR
jgi:DnaK suppressor protein